MIVIIIVTGRVGIGTAWCEEQGALRVGLRINYPGRERGETTTPHSSSLASSLSYPLAHYPSFIVRKSTTHF